MTLVLYAITSANVAPPEGLAALLGRGLAVVYAEREEPARPQREAVLAFGRTIQELADAGPVLPMRFGTAVAGLEELATLVSEHEEDWSARLRAVRGCCELIVHVDHPSVEPAPSVVRSGRDYLLERVAAVRAVEALRHEVGDVLGPVAREVRSLPGDQGHDRFAVLVPRAAATVASTGVRRWAAEHPDLHVAVTGPWPPFSFCEDVA
jgi:hypothetical protein